MAGVREKGDAAAKIREFIVEVVKFYTPSDSSHDYNILLNFLDGIFDVKTNIRANRFEIGSLNILLLL